MRSCGFCCLCREMKLGFIEERYFFYLILPSHLTAFRSLVAKLLPYENFAHGVFANILRKPCRNKRFESEALFRFCSDELASKV